MYFRKKKTTTTNETVEEFSLLYDKCIYDHKMHNTL